MNYLFKTAIQFILGLASGIFLGVTGIIPSAIILLILNLLNIGGYKSNLGAILFVMLFPVTIGSVYEFYKSKQIDYYLSLILLISITIGSYVGSKFVAGEKGTLTPRTIKYFSGLVTFSVGTGLLYSAYYDIN
jgi:uncharacterized membrane protein YfcA